MAHGLRVLQQWNQWLNHQFLGRCLLEAEQQALTPLLQRHFGKHAVLIGVEHQSDLLKTTPIPCHTVVSSLFPKDKKPDHGYIEANFHDLPILTGDVDLVILPHTLDLIDNPRQLLGEACRIIKPEGLIVICGFNPNSLWGLRKLCGNRQRLPWSANFIQANKIKKWLQLADFEMEKKTSTLFRPPLTHHGLYERLHFLEKVGHFCLPALGGVYILLARAKMVPLTPIRLKWTQKLSNIRISTSIPGHIAHH